MTARRSRPAAPNPAQSSTIDRYRAQHLSIVDAAGPEVGPGAKFDESESPLVWLARRKGADGRPLIEAHQLQAGERLRADFTCAQMMPRVTANWHAPVAGRGRDAGTSTPATERVIAARQRLRHALDMVGSEFSGLLVDVCCFLKKLETIERERQWPARSAKVVLQLALERLARHYGYRAEVKGKPSAQTRAWVGEGSDATDPEG
ncbi:DUF6456 domain-containing protein [Pseudorhodoplanes sp.]|jgi:hypothetical protein|uniref:DUF6456 domain-containing protein n=1 Tax=Pseudorhodoplanes sp. TaxID=1934341 RepID=UPI002CE6BF30|nr:DUF6456 domain-containing protein [Pseudorhodoplanes sp.]HWV41287.1 DUF6456 domain-containing protein [Pseudorhodoplanes sp.]